MSDLDDFWATASSQLEEDTGEAGVPSYLHAANSHQVAAGGFSLLDPSSWGESAANLGKLAATSVIRGASSVYNIVPQISNWFGAELDQADTYEWISKADSDLAAYYSANESTVNIVGDVLGSIVPGMAGVKALNYGQKALAAYAKGKQGLQAAAWIGTLPTKTATIGFEYGQKIAATSQSFKYLDAQVLKAVGLGYAQQALESAAFMAAAQATMSESPLFEKQDMSDLFWNSVWGGAVGGGIMGSIAAAQTAGAIKRGVISTNRILNPAAIYSETAPTLGATDKIITKLYDLHHPPVQGPVPAGTTAETAAAISTSFQNTLAKRQDKLWNEIRTEVHALTKDAELGNQFTDSLRGLDFDTSVGNIQYLADVKRAGTSGRTSLESLYAKVMRGDSAEELPNMATNWLKLHGEDAGAVLREAPPVLNLADTLSSSEKVLNKVKGYGFKLGDNWSPAGAKDHFETEARNIWAQRAELKLDYDTPIGALDLPVLERAYQDGLQSVTLTDGTVLGSQELLAHIQKVKFDQAEILTGLSTDPAKRLSTEEIAKRINVKRSYFEGTEEASLDASKDLFAFQSNPVKDHYLKPSFAKLVYDVQPMNDLNGFVLDAITHAKVNQKELRAAADRLFVSEFPDIAAKIPSRISDSQILNGTRYEVNQGLFHGQNANYGTLGSTVQQIGSIMNQWKSKLFKAVEDRFTAPAYRVLNSQEASDDIVKAYNLVLGSPEKYVFDEVSGELVNRKIWEWERNGAEGMAPRLVDANSPTRLAVKSAEAREFFKEMIAHNDSYLDSTAKRLSLQVGTHQQADLKGNLYFSPPDPKNYPHFAFVVDSTVTGTGHVRMIHANTAGELEQLISRVDSSKGLKAITKAENEAFLKAKQDYQYSLGINENYINTAMTRQGISAPFFATTDAKKIVEEFLDWRKRTDVANAREWIKLKYAAEVEHINQLAKSYDDVALSVKANTGKFAAKEVQNPYSNIVKTMLDVSTKDEYPIWTPLNRLAEKSVSALVGKLTESFSKAEDSTELARISRVLEESGIHANFTDAATMALANHSAPKPVLENFIRKANSVLSFMMLRADPLNAVNNGLGHTVLYGTETRDLIKNIIGGNSEAAGKLAGLAKVNVPGGIGSVLSPSKLAADSYACYAKLLGKDPAMKDLEVMFKAHGWMPNFLEQERSIVEAATLKGIESAADLEARSNLMVRAAQGLAKPATSLNEGVEGMNRFVSAYTAKRISDLAVQHGLMQADEQLAYINTFVNRTQGNYIASQRPMLFSGPVGQAVGLFQTYQFNLMQQLFRYVAEGGNKSAAYLLGLQGTVYGMNGLPAFNAINQHIVGNWSGNTQHKDIISQTYDTAGKEAGDWLLYGMASNMFLHPDLKVNLYSRGDINPRQVTVIPTTLADVPIVGAAAKLFKSVSDTSKKIAAGGDPYSTFLQGIEHAGISRPLAGLAQTAEAFGNPQLQAYSTTSKGTIIGSNDLFSLATFGRIAGGRPLDEAIVNDAVYRSQAYDSSRHKAIQVLGEAVKTKVQTGTLDPETLHGFMKSYVESGGKQDKFASWMNHLVMTSNTSAANQLSKDLKSPTSQYLQSVMGGYRMQDLVNY